MASDSDKHFSLSVSRALDCLGKSQSMVKYRVKIYREQQRKFCTSTTKARFIVAGSKGEGLTAPRESDQDVMIEWPGVICADNIQDILHTRNRYVLQTERNDTPAGYTKLKLVTNRGHLYWQEVLFQDEKGNKYMSSDFFLTEMQQAQVQQNPDYVFNFHERSGPSIPSTVSSDQVHSSTVSYDLVFAFICVCPDLLKAFITRPRRYNRPDRNILNDISQMESHVVPIGCKESDTSYQEWRICFTKAELHLVQGFNDTETKLYILLKMISKMLKEVSKEITSYVMKNVALWLVELYPAESFTEQLLTTQLVQALLFLKKCIEVNFLPSYMIPDRNLLAGRLDQTQRLKLTTELSAMIHEGGCLLLRCEKLQVMMSILYREPAMAEEFRWRRNMREKLSLFESKCNKDRNALLNLFVVLPDFRELVRQGYCEEALAVLWCERNYQMLS